MRADTTVVPVGRTRRGRIRLHDCGLLDHRCGSGAPRFRSTWQDEKAYAYDYNYYYHYYYCDA